MKKKILALCLFTALAFSCAAPSAAEPYRNYTFDKVEVWPEPQAYVVDDYISTDKIGPDNLMPPADLEEGAFKLDGVKDPTPGTDKPDGEDDKPDNEEQPGTDTDTADTPKTGEGTEGGTDEETGEEPGDGDEGGTEGGAASGSQSSTIKNVLSDPEDFAVSQPDGYIAIADTKNNRVIILNSDREFLQAIYYIECYIPEEEQEGKTLLKTPTGVFFTRNEQMLFVADSGNKRILKYALNKETGLFESYECLWEPAGINEYLAGSGASASDEQKYEPLKVVADEGGRIFVVSKGNHKGLIQLTAQGEFVKFVGATRTQATLSALWRRLLTTKQRDRIQDNLSTEYTNIFLDSEGLIFGTVGSMEASVLASHFDSNSVIGAQVKRITSNGDDVLARNGVLPPSGDYANDYSDRNRWSFFTDVTVSNTGIYSCLDSNHGRVFTYNPNGELLYVFGAKGDTMGAFKNCTAIDLFDDSTIGVLDKSTGQITVFTPTEYGQTILKATMQQASRDYDASLATWNDVLNMSANSQLAYRNIGKIQYIKGDYKAACDSFFLAYDQEEYSKAFAKYRNQLLEDIMPIIMTVIIALVVLYIIYKIVRNTQGFIKRGGREKHE